MVALWGLALVICLSAGATPSFAAATHADVVVGAAPGSILEALLESQYSEWMELVEHAAMLHPLEQLVGSGSKLTIFAPRNHQLQTNIKSYLLMPVNADSLKRVVQFHVLLERVTASEWHNASVTTLGIDSVPLTVQRSQLFAGDVEVVAPDSIITQDGVVHGVDEMLLPNSIMEEYVDHSTRQMSSPLPTGAPVLDSRHAQLLEKQVTRPVVKLPLAPAHSPSIPPTLAPSIAPAPGPAMGPSASPWGVLGEDEVTTFIAALYRFGGYSEFAGLLVDLTSLGSEISKLVNMGYRLTILAPEDKAWTNALTVDQLNSQTAIEHILHYHIIPEYQTEESLYSTLRRMGRSHFSTLRVPEKLTGHELDGQVVFGDGELAAGVVDHDIFTDGRISVQGINKVLIPPEVIPERTSRRRPVKGTPPMRGPPVTEAPPPPSKVERRNLHEVLPLDAGPGAW